MPKRNRSPATIRCFRKATEMNAVSHALPENVAVLFVCLGNICRSPMAEFVLRDFARRAGVAHRVQVASAGTSGWHDGENMHSGTRRVLQAHGIAATGFTSRKVECRDGMRYDFIIAMDDDNVAALKQILDAQAWAKVAKITDWLPESGYNHVPDPYFTGDFDETWRVVSAGCSAMLAQWFGVRP